MPGFGDRHGPVSVIAIRRFRRSGWSEFRNQLRHVISTSSRRHHRDQAVLDPVHHITRSASQNGLSLAILLARAVLIRPRTLPALARPGKIEGAQLVEIDRVSSALEDPYPNVM